MIETGKILYLAQQLVTYVLLGNKMCVHSNDKAGSGIKESGVEKGLPVALLWKTVHRLVLSLLLEIMSCLASFWHDRGRRKGQMNKPTFPVVLRYQNPAGVVEMDSMQGDGYNV